MGERAGLFEETSDFDVSGFKPKPPERTPGPAAEEIRAVSEGSDFRSREAGPPVKKERGPTAKRSPRLHRTGRSTQFNVKLRAETVESFYDIADRQSWTMGETVERALAALKSQLGS